MKDQFCAIYHCYGILEEEHFDTKEESIEFLESEYDNDQCFPHCVVDESTMAVVWSFDVVEL